MTPPKDYATELEPWDIREAQSRRSHRIFLGCMFIAIAGLAYMLLTGGQG